MSQATVAKRYADALFQLADEKNSAESLMTELAIVKEVFKANDSYIELLNHPQITNQKKGTLIDNAFSQCSKDITNMMKLLIERQRIGNIFDIIDQTVERYNDANGIAEATVSSVRELSDNEKEKVITSLKKQLRKKEIIINNVIDPSVLGGLKIKVGNTIYDGTISGKLNQMKHNIGVTTN